MGGGSRPLPEWFGALILRRIVHVQRGICLVWGVWTLARMVWGTYAVKIEVQMAFAQVGTEIKCPRVPVWVKGGGCNRYLGNAQIDPAFFYLGLPLQRAGELTRSASSHFTLYFLASQDALEVMYVSESVSESADRDFTDVTLVSDDRLYWCFLGYCNALAIYHWLLMGHIKSTGIGFFSF